MGTAAGVDGAFAVAYTFVDAPGVTTFLVRAISQSAARTGTTMYGPFKTKNIVGFNGVCDHIDPGAGDHHPGEGQQQVREPLLTTEKRVCRHQIKGTVREREPADSPQPRWRMKENRVDLSRVPTGGLRDAA
jgi:hypothetical protein